MKSAVEDEPSAETLSVVDEALPPPPSPPNSKTSPDGRSQQIWNSLGCIKVTDVAVNVPTPSNQEQEFGDFLPPQARFPHRVNSAVATGRSPILQLRPVFGKKISAVLNSTPQFLYPPTVRKPKVEHLTSLRLKLDIFTLSFDNVLNIFNYLLYFLYFCFDFLYNDIDILNLLFNQIELDTIFINVSSDLVKLGSIVTNFSFDFFNFLSVLKDLLSVIFNYLLDFFNYSLQSSRCTSILRVGNNGCISAVDLTN